MRRPSLSGDDFHPVLKPRHDNSHPSGVEAIEVTALCSFTIGNALKYVIRAWDSGKFREDLAKSRWYLRHVPPGMPTRPHWRAQAKLTEMVAADDNPLRALLLRFISAGNTEMAAAIIDAELGPEES